ncbi:hypothetical protein F2Q69_00009739 [Brassica cretica]|uniref:Uncharacterized protein n=1 Tax=Brassica cretica TaxID=69181 RepID=A0A8S9PD53_BRACR|nr:hypothetical protein F2Q69_00009739 [Brassica cretica]
MEDFSLGFLPEGRSCAAPGLLSGVAKSILFLQTLVVPRGLIARVLAVKVSTCLVKVLRPFFVGGEHLFKLLERHGVGWCVGRGYVRCGSVEIGATASVKRSQHVIRAVS